MRTAHLHPFSLFTGFALSLLVVVSMGQKVVPVGPATADAALGEELLPTSLLGVRPRTWVQITEGVPYIVPQGKVLAVTALGGTRQHANRIQLLVDGTQELESQPTPDTGAGTTMKAVNRGLSVPAGSTVEVLGGDTNPPDARAWGFLADA